MPEQKSDVTLNAGNWCLCSPPASSHITTYVSYTLLFELYSVDNKAYPDDSIMPMSGSRLCDQCQTVLSLGPDDSGEVKEHHATGETFFQAIKQGCYICSWAWRKYDQAKGPTAHSPVHHTACKWVVPGHQVNIELIIFIHEKEGGALWGGNFLGLDSSIEGIVHQSSIMTCH